MNRAWTLAQRQHELRHTRTTRTVIPRGVGQTGPLQMTIGFGFAGRRSCSVADETLTVDFEVSMSGVSDAVVADYPELLASVVPSAEELERYDPGGFIATTVRPHGEEDVDVPILSPVFGFGDGILFPDGKYRFLGYTPVSESIAACRAHGVYSDEQL